MKISKASVSRTETGETPYTQDFLEGFARAVDCAITDLINRPPTDPDGLWAAWGQLWLLSPDDRALVVRILRAIFEEPEPDSKPAAPKTRRPRKPKDPASKS